MSHFCSKLVNRYQFSTASQISKTNIAQINATTLKDIIGKDKRAFIIYDEKNNKFNVSHSDLSSLLTILSDIDESQISTAEDQALQRDFDKHEGFFLEIGNETNAIHGAFIHKTKRGAGAGGVRYWTYDNLSQYLCDGLRLSRGYELCHL